MNKRKICEHTQRHQQHTRTEARNKTERKNSKRKNSKTENPVLIYGDRVYRAIVTDLVGRKKKKENGVRLE